MSDNLELLNKIRNHVKKYDLPITNEVVLQKLKNAISDLNKKTDWKTKQKIMQTAEDWQMCYLSLYGSLQKMRDLDIDINESDDWFINSYGKKLTAEYMYPALLKAIKRKGLVCLPSFYFVYKDEKFSIKEEGEVLNINYQPKLSKPHLTIENLNEYEGFVCKMVIKNLKNEIIHNNYIIFSAEDILKRKGKSTSKDKGEKVYGKIKEDLSIWQEWTARMVEKTLIYGVLHKLRYTLPELEQIMLKFSDLEEDNACKSKKTEPVDQEIKQESPKSEQLDFRNPSPEVLKKSQDISEEYKITPELEGFNKNKIKEALEVCQNQEQKDTVLTRYLAEIYSFGEESKNKLFEFAGV